MYRFRYFYLLNIMMFSVIYLSSYGQKRIGNESKIAITDEELKVFNKVSSSLDTCSIGDGTIFRLLIIGNSFSYHGKMEKIGWYHGSGMAASSMENDFAHILFRNIQKILPDRRVCMQIKNLAAFERGFHTYDLSEFKNANYEKADLIIFQLGQNVKFTNEMTPSLFEARYSELVNVFKGSHNPITICTNSFPPSREKNKVISEVALKTGSFLVDLSHLDFDDQNYAISEENYPGDKSLWLVEGIGKHPGDYGMKNIAMQIFSTVNAALKIKLESR